jgi:hypothetical protein
MRGRGDLRTAAGWCAETRKRERKRYLGKRYSVLECRHFTGHLCKYTNGVDRTSHHMPSGPLLTDPAATAPQVQLEFSTSWSTGYVLPHRAARPACSTPLQQLKKTGVREFWIWSRREMEELLLHASTRVPWEPSKCEWSRNVCRTVKISAQRERPNYKLSRKAYACCTIKISATTMNPGALTTRYFQGA